MRAKPAVSLLLICCLLAVSCQRTQVQDYGDFKKFAADISDILSTQDVERLVAQTSRTNVRCDEQLVQGPGACQGLAVGTVATGFDVKYFGQPGLTVEDSGKIRQLMEGMLFGADLQAPEDEFGGARLHLQSTLTPDPLVWFSEDNPDKLPPRGDLAITYIGRSPSEDAEVKRRLWVAVAERTDDVGWKVRLWLVGYVRPDHPALRGGEGFQLWQGP